MSRQVAPALRSNHFKHAFHLLFSTVTNGKQFVHCHLART